MMFVGVKVCDAVQQDVGGISRMADGASPHELHGRADAGTVDARHGPC